MTSSNLGVVLSHQDPDLVLGHSDDFYFVLWRNRTTAEGIAKMAEDFQSYASGRSRKCALLTAIVAGAEAPGAEEKKRLAAVLRQSDQQILASAVLFEGDGFLAASARFIVTGLTMLARQTYPHRVFKGIEETSTWLEVTSASLGATIQASRVVAQYQAFRAKADAR